MYEPSSKANKIVHLETTTLRDTNRVPSNKHFTKKELNWTTRMKLKIIWYRFQNKTVLGKHLTECELDNK